MPAQRKTVPIKETSLVDRNSARLLFPGASPGSSADDSKRSVVVAASFRGKDEPMEKKETHRFANVAKYLEDSAGRRAVLTRLRPGVVVADAQIRRVCIYGYSIRSPSRRRPQPRSAGNRRLLLPRKPSCHGEAECRRKGKERKKEKKEAKLAGPGVDNRKGA